MLNQSIERLRFCASVCPCFVSEHEHAMRISDMLLQSVPIRWYRKIQVSPYDTATSTLLEATNDLFSGVCGKIGSDQIPRGLSRLPGSKPTHTQYVGIEATMTVIGTSKGPALKIISNKYVFVDNELQLEENNSSLNMSKTILFADMHVATPGRKSEWSKMGLSPDDGLMIYAKGGESEQADKTRIITCKVLPGSKLSLLRDEAIRHINNLISWDKDGPVSVEEEGRSEKKKEEEESEAIVTSQGRSIRIKGQSHHREVGFVEVD